MRESSGRRRFWIRALIVSAALVLLTFAALGIMRASAPGPPTEGDAAGTPKTAGTLQTAPPSGPIATIAALATAMVAPRNGAAATLTSLKPAETPAASPTGTTQTPAASATTATQQPTRTAAASTREPALAAGQAPQTILDEDWSGSHRWPDNPQSTAWYTAAGYRLFARRAAQFVAVGAPLDSPVVDVIVSGRFRKVGGPPGGGYGLIVRDQGPGPRDGLNQTGRYYLLEAGDAGEFGIWRRDGSLWIELIPWRTTDIIHPGDGTNELVVRAIGQELTFLVNGISIAVQTDTSPGEGGVGIFVGGDGNQVVLERFSVQLPE